MGQQGLHGGAIQNAIQLQALAHHRHMTVVVMTVVVMVVAVIVMVGVGVVVIQSQHNSGIHLALGHRQQRGALSHLIGKGRLNS